MNKAKIVEKSKEIDAPILRKWYCMGPQNFFDDL